jgi:hypothetical protein
MKGEMTMPKENDLEGAQDQGGKHGGQAGVPKPTPRRTKTGRDKDVPASAESRTDDLDSP